eukprot:476267-Pyramimonas_sp.AAC.1
MCRLAAASSDGDPLCSRPLRWSSAPLLSRLLRLPCSALLLAPSGRARAAAVAPRLVLFALSVLAFRRRLALCLRLSRPRPTP